MTLETMGMRLLAEEWKLAQCYCRLWILCLSLNCVLHQCDVFNKHLSEASQAPAKHLGYSDEQCKQSLQSSHSFLPCFKVHEASTSILILQMRKAKCREIERQT